jgi:hypothetical protein
MSPIVVLRLSFRLMLFVDYLSLLFRTFYTFIHNTAVDNFVIPL